MISLGLDIGTNSVGSAWVDYETGEIRAAVTVFPAGVDESDKMGRGEPKGQQRRQARQLMRLVRRKAARRKKLLDVLVQHGLLPADPQERQRLFSSNDPTRGETPWHLRRKGLTEELTAYEFGRVLVHMNQRRGAFGIRVEQHEEDEAADEARKELSARKGRKKAEPKGSDVEGKVKAGIEQARKMLAGRTFGQAIADMLDDSLKPVGSRQFVATPVRNRRDSYRYVATREMIREEFLRLWEKQLSFGGPLSRLLTPELKKLLDDPEPQDPKVARIWRHGGIIFGQRRHFWRIGALGRCKLEPSERCCPFYDMHAQYFRVLETVNNIRVQEFGKDWEPLPAEQREKLIRFLRSQKSATVSSVLKAIGLDRNSLKKRQIPDGHIRTNLEADKQREINCDWFYSGIVLGVFGEERWLKLPPKQQEGVNRALLKHDPTDGDDEQKLRQIAARAWELEPEAVDKLIAAWKSMASQASRRLKLSRTAIRNLIPYMNRLMCKSGKWVWPTVTDARQEFAEDGTNNAEPEQRARYAFWIRDELRKQIAAQLKDRGEDPQKVAHYLSFRGLNKADRHYLKKHRKDGAIVLPPAPFLANPVARKAVYVVKRHVEACLARYKRVPDRIVIEMTRDATKPKKIRDQELALNRTREKVRKDIIKQFCLEGLPRSQREKAITRVLLLRQQGLHSAYSGVGITEKAAAMGRSADGREIEIDHIIPRSRGGGDGLGNLVVCYADENRDKGNRCPKDWLKERFSRVEQVFAPLVESDKWRERSAGGFFTWADNKVKWDNLHRTPAEVSDEWRPSQLSDTAVAAREIAAYLQAALYPHEPVDDKDINTRRIFFTKGIHTKRLRDDWQLYQNSGSHTADIPIKDRHDHRHHAIDAAIIALTDAKILWQIGRLDREYERRCWEAKQKGLSIESVPRPQVPVPGCWQDPQELRKAIIEPLYRPISGDLASIWAVAHTPERRRIAGPFHEQTMYGPVRGEKEQFTSRIPVWQLKGSYLKLPRDGSDKPGGNSYIVHDLSLRRYLREIVSQAGLDPDKLTEKQAENLFLEGKFRWPNGVPINAVVCRLTLGNSCVRIGAAHDDPLGHTARVYKGGSNHHIEIRDSGGRWTSDVVSTFEAARRKRAFLECRKRNELQVLAMGLSGDQLDEALRRARYEAHLAHPIVDRRDDDRGAFVMSLCIGEMLLMRHKETNKPGIFVVRKITGDNRIYVTAHFDARSATAEKDSEGHEIPGSERELIELRASHLQELGVDPYPAAVKVRVSPLGEVRLAERD